MNVYKKTLVAVYYYLMGLPEICDWCGEIKEKYHNPSPYADDSQYYQKCCKYHIVDVEVKNIIWFIGYYKICVQWFLKGGNWKRKLVIRIKEIVLNLATWESGIRGKKYQLGTTVFWKIYTKLC